MDIRHLLRTSQKKNKIREATPEPSFSKLCLDKKKNIDKEKRKNQNNKIKLRLYNNNDEDSIDKIINLEEELKEALKEKEKLEKDIENFKLRELGYNQKIEELTFALNNLSQENMLLKMDLEKQRKDLDKKKREINKLRTNRNLNLNLNNQTTYNINTASNTNMNVNMDLETIKSNNYKKIEENNTRSFVSKTPEGSQRREKELF